MSILEIEVEQPRTLTEIAAELEIGLPPLNIQLRPDQSLKWADQLCREQIQDVHTSRPPLGCAASVARLSFMWLSGSREVSTEPQGPGSRRAGPCCQGAVFLESRRC